MNAFIAKTETQHTGGNCMADVIELTSGRVIVISDEVVCVFPNLKTWDEGPVEDCSELETSEALGYGRCEASEAGLTFVQRITTYEPDGPVSVDLLHLADGRVLGIDTETVCLYPTLADFDSEDGMGTVDGSVDLT
jgi:hypothetical protein